MNETENDKSIRLLNESFKLLEGRVQVLRELMTIERQQQLRDRAYIFGVLDVMTEFIATTSGVTRAQVRERVEHQAAKHLDKTLQSIQEKDPEAAAVLDDRDLSEVPTDAKADDEGEPLRQLRSAICAFGQLLTQNIAHTAAAKIMLRSIVAQVERRSDSDVAAELEQVAEMEHERVLLTIGDRSPDLADVLDIRRMQPPDNPQG